MSTDGRKRASWGNMNNKNTTKRMLIKKGRTPL
jgi:hypothetical protein